jgi:fumarate reductase subunit D
MTAKKLYSFVFILCLLWCAWIMLNISGCSSVLVGCLFYKITHLPCPACGSTRSVLALLQGDCAGAFYANPFGFLLLMGLVVLPLWLVFDWISHKNSFFKAYKKMESLLKTRCIAIPAIVLVLANWIWNMFKYL